MAISAPRQNYLACLQAYRGIAASSVLFYHVSEQARTRLGSEPWFGIFHAGNLGVDFFFVLSGFIILYTNGHSLGNPLAARKYVYRRLTRIYPVFLSICFIKLAFMFAGGSVRGGKDGLGFILSSLLLWPLDRAPFLDVAWTLSFEMTFYFLFLFLILYGAGLWRLIQLHALAVALLNLPWLPGLTFPATFLFSPFFLQFYLGCAACYLVRNWRWGRGLAWGVLMGGAAMFVLGYGLYYHLEALGELGLRTYFGLAFALIVVGSVALGAEFERLIPGWLMATGDASYSIYLMHGNLMNLGINYLSAHGGGAGRTSPWMLLALAISVLVGGYLYYLFVEKPLLNLCRRHSPK
jgi:exopolysaccharide production protein ExoZ